MDKIFAPPLEKILGAPLTELITKWGQHCWQSVGYQIRGETALYRSQGLWKLFHTSQHATFSRFSPWIASSGVSWSGKCTRGQGAKAWIILLRRNKFPSKHDEKTCLVTMIFLNSNLDVLGQDLYLKKKINFYVGTRGVLFEPAYPQAVGRFYPRG